MRIGFLLYYIVIDHNNMDPIPMIQRSRRASKGHLWKLFSVSVWVVLINILGVIPFGIGLLWTLPLAQSAMAKLYRDIE